MSVTSRTASSQRRSIPPLVPIAGRCAKFLSLLPPRKAAVNLSTLSSFVSCRQTSWHEEDAIVALTVALLAGQLSPRTFQLSVFTGCINMGNRESHMVGHNHSSWKRSSQKSNGLMLCHTGDIED